MNRNAIKCWKSVCTTETACGCCCPPCHLFPVHPSKRPPPHVATAVTVNPRTQNYQVLGCTMWRAACSARPYSSAPVHNPELTSGVHLQLELKADNDCVCLTVTIAQSHEKAVNLCTESRHTQHAYSVWTAVSGHAMPRLLCNHCPE